MTDCKATGKVAYHSKLQALQARGKIAERVRGRRSKRPLYERYPYRCTHCRLWHLTSTPR